MLCGGIITAGEVAHARKRIRTIGKRTVATVAIHEECLIDFVAMNVPGYRASIYEGRTFKEWKKIRDHIISTDGDPFSMARS